MIQLVPKGDPKGYPKGVQKEIKKGDPKRVYGVKKENHCGMGKYFLCSTHAYPYEFG